MSALAGSMATACAVAGVVIGAGVLVRGRDARQAVGVLLDFLLAAGLLRLSEAEASWTSLATVTLVVLVRRVVSANLGGGAVGQLRGLTRAAAPGPDGRR